MPSAGAAMEPASPTSQKAARVTGPAGSASELAGTSSNLDGGRCGLDRQGDRDREGIHERATIWSR